MEGEILTFGDDEEYLGDEEDVPDEDEYDEE